MADANIKWIYFDKRNGLLALPTKLNLPDGLRKALQLLGCFSKYINIKRNAEFNFRPIIENELMKMAESNDLSVRFVIYHNINELLLR